MNGLAFLENINNVDDDLIIEAENWMHPKMRRPAIFVGVIAIASCFCLAVGLMFVFVNNANTPALSPPISNSILPGSDRIYPTVMVNGKLYKWAQGDAIIDTLPVGSVYYGKINHSDNLTPEKDREFVSVFSADGEVFVDPTVDLVYIKITTDWLDNGIVIFEPVIERE